MKTIRQLLEEVLRENRKLKQERERYMTVLAVMLRREGGVVALPHKDLVLQKPFLIVWEDDADFNLMQILRLVEHEE